ncbi:XrtA/PEP-CTERM system-associated ATPase [Photobacterium jeanii]|uniref:XrtA/PEP-CTERM system-associated ATPase n=1 Tax=Photobacterium jeanii TaxID=858640 RepID=UPI0008347476|nr:XrtA/PEP-CTERM system-associated ATPase [Photobacterium jeanii]PST90893.1 general secretion pathway protein GspA [Photobacterium jeanii]
MYEAHFGLSDKPFKLSPDPRFFFASPHHDKAVSYLQYGLSQGEGFIVITGPIGTGKTTLARNLLSQVDESIVAVQIATTRLTPDELVRLVAAKFNLEIEGLSKADILKRMESYLLQLHAMGKRALLIVDEAQNLPAETVEELRMLSNFQLDDQPLIQSFLLGQEELKGIIELPEMEQFRQRIIASCHLKPFDEQQTRDYIKHRLTQVGWSGYPELDDDIFARIAEYTSGIPRKINIFADRLFLYAFMAELAVVNLDAVEQVVEEMGGELSGSLAKNSAENLPQDEVNATKVGLEQPANAELNISPQQQAQYQKSLKVLDQVSAVLDDVIQRKISTIRHLDKLIRQKRKLLSEDDVAASSVQKSETDVIPEVQASDPDRVLELASSNTEDAKSEQASKLKRKHWYRALMKTQGEC